MDYSTQHGILGLSEAELACLQAQVDETSLVMDADATGEPLWPFALPRAPKHASPYRARHSKPWQSGWRRD